MTKLNLLFSAVLGLSCAAAPIAANAANDNNADNLAKPGVYIGVGVGKANTHVDYNEVYPNGVLVIGQAFADAFQDIMQPSYNAFAGYRLNPYLAFEGNYADYYSTSDHIDGVGDSSTKVYGIALSSKFSYPVTSWFSPYARLGVDWVHQKNNVHYDNDPQKSLSSDVNKLMPQVGLGVDFIIKRRFTIGLDWTHDFAHKPIERIDNISLSVAYTF